MQTISVGTQFFEYDLIRDIIFMLYFKLMFVSI